MSVIVRRATFEDADVIAGFALKLMEQHLGYDPLRFAKLANHEQAAAFYGSRNETENSVVFVAELDGKVVGFAYVEFEEKNYLAFIRQVAWLHDIFVDETARGHEIGKALIDAAREAGKEFGASKLMLSVAFQNNRARQVFERAGFRTTMFEMMLDLTK